MKNAGISAALNAALTLAGGDFAAFLDHDDEITPDALFEIVSHLNTHPDTDLLYSDEDKLDRKGARCDVFFKPDWSPEALEGCMYTAHFACYRMDIVRARDLGAGMAHDAVERSLEKASHSLQDMVALALFGDARRGDGVAARLRSLAGPAGASAFWDAKRGVHDPLNGDLKQFVENTPR